MCQGINGGLGLLVWQRMCASARFSCNDGDRADPGNFGQVLIQGFFSVRILEILGSCSYFKQVDMENMLLFKNLQISS